MEKFQKFVKGFDDNTRHLLGVLHDNRKKHIGRKYIDIIDLFQTYMHLYTMVYVKYLQKS